MRSRLYPLAILLAGSALAAEGQSDITLHDTARNRNIPVKVFVPGGRGGHLPVIVFSPGFGANREIYRYLGTGWSAAGYVVILATHKDSDTRAIGDFKAPTEPDKSFDLQVERTGDVSFIINSLDQVERAIPALNGRIDRSHIGVAGHSMGGGTALLIGGATAVRSGESRRGFRDQRVSAVVAMSPQGPGEEGFDDQSWNDIRIPIMTMSGTKDGGAGKQGPEWRLEPFQHMPPGDKYHVLAEGAFHISFAGGPRFRSCIVSVTTAFWDTYLKGDASAKSRIASAGPCMVRSK